MACVAGLGACSGGAANAPTRTVTVEGVDYQIPENVEKVAPAIGSMVQMTAMIAGEKPVIAAAPTQQISDRFKQVLPAYEKGNPNGNDTSNLEQVISSGAQVVYAPGPLFSDEQKKQLADAGITFVAINGLDSVDAICSTVESIGQILGGDMADKAAAFSEFWKGNVKDAQKRTSKLKDSEKPKVLNIAYSNGAWTTEAGESLVNSYIEAAGGNAVSKDYVAKEAENSGQGKAGNTLDEEQIVTWNPDYIITYSAEATEQLLGSKALASVNAVKNKHVYTSPKGLYLWAVRSGEGSLMAPWIGTKINADLFDDIDMKQMVQDFFKTYYAYDLSDADAEAILDGTY